MIAPSVRTSPTPLNFDDYGAALLDAWRAYEAACYEGRELHWPEGAEPDAWSEADLLALAEYVFYAGPEADPTEWPGDTEAPLSAFASPSQIIATITETLRARQIEMLPIAVECPLCEGTGEALVTTAIFNDPFELIECDRCEGTGEIELHLDEVPA